MTSRSKRLISSACLGLGLGLGLGMLVTLLIKRPGIQSAREPAEEEAWRELTDEELLA